MALTMFIDSHTHLFYPDFQNDIQEVIQRANDVGVTKFIVPGTNLDTSKQAIELAEKQNGVFACVGFHPLDTMQASDVLLQEIERLSLHPKVVAIGEIGLDYFYDSAPRDVQSDLFAAQIDIAVRRNLPIVVHTRDSMLDAITIVEKKVAEHPTWKQNNLRGVFHCFSGTAEEAERLFALQFLVSFPGIVTFKKSTSPELLQRIGISKIMVETDSPYLTPAPYRGKRNESSHIPLIAQKIAEICDTTIEHVASTTTANACRLFQLPSQQ